MTDSPDRLERKRVRRARRQALVLMLASGLLSLMVLYGVWSLVARLISSTG